MLTRILVATDGSEVADRAVRLGAEIAARFDAELVLVNVLVEEPTRHEIGAMDQLMGGLGPQQVAPLHMDSLMETMNRRSDATPVTSHAEALHQIATHVLERAAGIAEEHGVREAATVLLHGKPAHAIADAASSREADLVVLGTRGLGGVEGALLGSVSQHVSSHAPVSCLTVK